MGALAAGLLPAGGGTAAIPLTPVPVGVGAAAVVLAPGAAVLPAPAPAAVLLPPGAAGLTLAPASVPVGALGGAPTARGCGESLLWIVAGSVISLVPCSKGIPVVPWVGRSLAVLLSAGAGSSTSSLVPETAPRG
jgi:hypothetical protein